MLAAQSPATAVKYKGLESKLAVASHLPPSNVHQGLERKKHESLC